MGKYFAIFAIVAILIAKIDCKVTVSFKLHHYENLNHQELNGGCCDQFFSCGSCDNRFNLCFDVHGGNNQMTSCAYGNYQTDRLFENNDNFAFPDNLGSGLSNPIIFTIDSWSNGFRSKIEVWDNDVSPNADDKIDFYGYNYGFEPARTVALATTHTVTLTGLGESTTIVQVKVYCTRHYYGTSSGCSTYCLARDDVAGHYDCDDITGAKVCYPGWTGANCQIDINECAPNPCLNGGTCTNLANDFRCNCPPGTTGKTCTDINECSSNPCESGGTCIDSLNYFTCACTIHYTGVRCQFEVDHCSSSPCRNGATCLGLDDNGIVECTCADGYTGVHCGTDIDECVGINCTNGGSCVDLVNGFECDCLAGYEGLHCEVDVRDECVSNPCQNNASCVDEVNGYVCVCPAGFQSDQCEENVNECEPNPCDQGNCTDKIDKYKCECFEGYTGVNCSQEIDDCVGNRCHHNSTCQDGFTTYTCDCLPGYTGQYCETDIDECALDSYPCLHGGVCDQSQAVNNFTCDCTSTGYMGVRCDVDLNECDLTDPPVCREDETCINDNGSYLCGPPPYTPHLPGLCRTSLCYNNGTCSIVGGEYRCICTGDYTGELCETPTALCTPNPCLNGGFCRVNTGENGTVTFQCRCEDNYSGPTCQLLIPGRNTGSNTAGGFTFWYIIPIIIILIIVIVVGSFFVYRWQRKRKAAYMDGEPTVYANPHAATIDIGPTLGATAAAPPLPPKDKLDKLGDPIDSSLTFENNLYSDIDELQIRGAHAPDAAPPPYALDEKGEKESPYAFGGYTPMGTAPLANGHAVHSPQEDSPYEPAPEPARESAQEQANKTDQGENEYSVDPTANGSVRRPFTAENGYSTRIQPTTRPDSAVAPPPLPRRHTLDLDHGHSPSPPIGPGPLSFRNRVPKQASTAVADASDYGFELPVPSRPDNPYDTEIFNDKDFKSEC